MPVRYVASLDDPSLVAYRDLKSPLSNRRSDRFVVEGGLLVERLLASGLPVVSVVVEQRLVEHWTPLVPERTTLLVIPDATMRELIGFHFHRGVLACGLRPPSGDLRRLRRPTGAATWAVCVGVKDPENLGGILRSSAAFGVHAVVLGQSCADPFSRRVARTSMGANLRLPLVESQDLAADLAILRDEFSAQLVATVLDADAEPLGDVAPAERTALLFGNEGEGLDSRWTTMCERRVTIPMPPGVDSLNVNVAAGIFLFHWRRGRH